MTRYKQNLVIHAILTIVLSCFTTALFAQSPDQSPDPSAGQDSGSPDAEIAGFAIGWADFKIFESGYESSVAIHPSGLIVEVHSSASTRITYTGLYYRIGKLDLGSGTVIWGGSHQWVNRGTSGSWPTVAITQEGYVILAYSNAFEKSGSTLWYSVGTLDLHGDTTQTIDFKVSNVPYDSGFHSSIAVNSSGTIAEEHESAGGNGIYYRLGHLNSTGKDNFSIFWDSGTDGKKFDNGSDPNISINDSNDVVEVHQVSATDHRLHYTRGTVSENRNLIDNFTTHPRYSENGRRPSVVLLNNVYVIELHASNYNSRTGLSELFNRVGTLDKQPTQINFMSNTLLGFVVNNGGIGSDGRYLISTAERGGSIYYSWAIAP